MSSMQDTGELLVLIIMCQQYLNNQYHKSVIVKYDHVESIFMVQLLPNKSLDDKPVHSFICWLMRFEYCIYNFLVVFILTITASDKHSYYVK